jgi:ferrous iron transport protein A
MKTEFNFDSELFSSQATHAARASESTGATQALSDLEPGGEAVVVDVEHTGAISRRLLDLGLLPDTPVKLLRRAPLGDPSVYELRGYRLCLRKSDASRVRVRMNGVAASATR